MAAEPQDETAVLRERIATLERELEAALREARTDALTGLLNRRGWEEELDREEARCERHGLEAAVLAADVDDLKAANRAGHEVGDALLRFCGEALLKAVRGGDVVARWGGDEFAVLAVQATPTAPEHLEERIQTILQTGGVSATVAVASRANYGNLRSAWLAADEELLARKARRG